MFIDQSARIATLHEWQAKDALIIQQLNESNSLLSERIAQLEKEKNELTQKVEKFSPKIEHRYSYCGSSGCPACAAGISQ